MAENSLNILISAASRWIRPGAAAAFIASLRLSHTEDLTCGDSIVTEHRLGASFLIVAGFDFDSEQTKNDFKVDAEVVDRARQFRNSCHAPCHLLTLA